MTDNFHHSTMPAQQKHVSLREVRSIASAAREKLSVAADEPDQDLRVLVLHANFLDGNRPNDISSKRD